MEASDLELVRAAAAGDERAFHALTDRHAPALFRSAMALSRNRADAEDLLQETLVAAYRGLKSFAGRSSVKTWMITILTRKAFKVMHRWRHHNNTMSLDATNKTGQSMTVESRPHQSGTTAAIDQKLDVMQVLQSMTEPHREILVLRELQGLSYEEIADVLGVPRGTVESRIYRARAEFRDRFGQPDA